MEESIEKAIDFEYLKLTVALVLLLIIVFMITSRFRTYPIINEKTNTGFAAGAEQNTTNNNTEQFAPYASILAPSTFRSDPGYDTGKIDAPPMGNYTASELFTNNPDSREHQSYPTRQLNPEFALLCGLSSGINGTDLANCY